MKTSRLPVMSERRAAKARSGELRLPPNSSLPYASEPIRRRRRLRPKPRSAEEFARIYHSESFLFYVHTLLLCCVCGAEDPQWAHTKSGGTGRKADVIHGAPLCADCHLFGPRSWHQGAKSFMRRHAHIDFTLTGPRAIEAFEEPEVQAWIELMKSDGTFDAWLRRNAA